MSGGRSWKWVLVACATITVAYLGTLTAINVLFLRAGLPADPDIWPRLVLPMVVLPYVAGGIVLGLLAGRTTWQPAIIVGLITTIGERVAVVGLGALVLATFRQVDTGGAVHYVEGTSDLIVAITLEALPHFTWEYILLGLPASVLILLGTAQVLGRLRHPPRTSVVPAA